MAYDEENVIQSVKYAGLFNFEQHACKTQKSTDYSDDDEEIYYLKVKLLESKKITLTYKEDVGLKKIDYRNKKERLPIGEIPLSSEAFTFANTFKEKTESPMRKYNKKDKSRNEHVTELGAYFDTFGYLFKKDSFGKYKKVSYEVVGNLLDRIYFLSDLMSECRIDDYKRDYNKIFYYTFYLLLGFPKTAKEGEEDDEPTPMHPVYPAALHLRDDNYRDDLKNKTFDHDDLIAEGLICENVESDSPTDESSLSYNNERYYIVHDYFSKDNDRVYLDITDYTNEYEDVPDKQIRQAHTTRRIEYAYVNRDAEERSIKLVYDFLYHFIKDITPIVDINFSSYKTLTLRDEVNLSRDPRFDRHYKDVLCEIAADVIKQEVEYALRNVHPILNKESLTPGWDIPDLYSAIHYSLLLTNGTMKVYRVCENPGCCNLYPVTITNKKQRFCSNRCRGASSQRSSRHHDALVEAGVIVEDEKKTKKGKKEQKVKKEKK